MEDPSNNDQGYTRNRIRAQLLPVLEQVFPQFRSTFARSSANCAQAADLLSDLAASDLLAVGVPPRIRDLQALPLARQSNVLRHWLLSAYHTTPTAAQLAQLVAQVGVCTTRGHRIHIKVGRVLWNARGKSRLVQFLGFGFYLYENRRRAKTFVICAVAAVSSPFSIQWH